MNILRSLNPSSLSWRQKAQGLHSFVVQTERGQGSPWLGNESPAEGIVERGEASHLRQPGCSVCGGRRPPAEVSCRSSTSLRLVLPPELGVFCVRGPADELSAVIEFPRQYELCHYTHVPVVYIHYTAARFLLLSDAVGGNRLMSEWESVGFNSSLLQTPSDRVAKKVSC